MSRQESDPSLETASYGFTIPTTAEAIYGTVLVAGVIAGESLYDPAPRRVLITCIVMIGIFYVTHVYAEVVAAATQDSPVAARVAERGRADAPMLLAVVVPGGVLLAAQLGRLSANAAISIALWVCVAQLVAAGVLLARRRSLSPWKTLSSGLACGACGLAVVVLKTALQY